jgi:hypothetical protein
MVSSRLYIKAILRLPGASIDVREHRFDAFIKLAAGEHDTVGASLTFKADVGADPCHDPDAAAAGVYFPQPHCISYSYLNQGWHR